MAKCGLNGVIHWECASDLETPLHKWGVSYLGMGQWKLPPQSIIRHLRADDWCLIFDAGGSLESIWYLWVEE